MSQTLNQLFGYVEIIAARKHEGDYLIINKNGMWKGAFGLLPSQYILLQKIDELKPFYTLEDLLNDMLQNETCFEL